MRALLELRLAERWPLLLLTELAAFFVAVVLISQGLVSFERPSRVVLVACLFALAAIWYDSRRTEMADRVEKREALHASLPASRLVQALARGCEPAMVVGVAMLMASLAFAVLGRGELANAGPWREDFLLLVGAGAWLLAVEAAQLFNLELQQLLRGLRLGWLFWAWAVVFFGGVGVAVGIMIGDDGARPEVFYLAFGRPGSVLLALVLALLMGTLSVLLYRDRDAMLGSS